MNSMANSQIDIKRLSFPNADAQLLLGLKGDKGDTGDKGDKGDTGDTGNGIASITHTGTSGAVKTYTITFTDGTSQTYDVTDGQVTTEQMDTAIDNAVTDVKSDISQINTLSDDALFNASWEFGMFSTSGDAPSTTRLRSNYIDLSDMETLDFHADSGYKYFWLLYDSSKTYISGSGNTWYASRQLVDLSDYPTAKYLRMQMQRTDNTVESGDYQYIHCIFTNVFSNFVQSIEHAIDLIHDIGLQFPLADLPIYATADNWKLIGSNGLCASDPTSRLIKYQVTAGQLLYLDLSKDNDVVYQFQNNASVPASATNNYLIGYSVAEDTDSFVRVPDGATYLIVSQLKTNTSNKVQTPSSASTDIVSLNKDAYDRLLQAKRPKNLSSNAYLTEPQPLVLLHFSDIHGDATELQRMVDFQNEYASLIDDSICTGDVVALRWSSDFDYWGAVDGAENILLAIGNHDVLTDTSGWDWTQRATQSEQYNRYFAPSISGWNCTYTSGKTYYYKDYSEKGIRLIVLNCMLTGNDDTAQLAWLNTVLADAKTNNYSVVVANHYMVANAEKIECNFSSLDKGVGNDVLPLAYLSAIQDYIDGGGKFICHICGHTHWDLIVKSTTYPDQLCVVIDALSRSQGNQYSDTQRTDATKSQDLANLITFDTSSGVIKIIRIGASIDHYLREKNCITINYNTGAIITQN